MKLNLSKEPVRVENGKKIFRFDCLIDGMRRPSEPSLPTKPEEQDNQDGSADPPVSTHDDNARDRWRLISAVKAWPTTGFWLPQMVDYGHDNGRVLKEAIALINQNKPDLTWNHSDDAKDIAGHVENAYWESSLDIPPGINADLVVDPDYDPKAAKGLTRGQLRNGSIGLSMDVSPSHPDMEWEQFVELQGREVDGEQVRWLPTQVYEVRHMALVPAGAGADPNAGRRSARTENLKQSPNKETTNMKEFFQNILGALGIDILLADDTTISDDTKAMVSERVESLKGAHKRYNELASAVQEFGRKLVADGEAAPSATETVAMLPSLLERAYCGDQLVAFQRDKAVKLFDQLHFNPDKPEMSDHEKRMRNRLAESNDLQYLSDTIADYEELVEKKYPESRRSSDKEELPLKAENQADGQDVDIRQSSQRLFSAKK